ncbi:hypothetical protein H8356DRAFT_937586 [Neocallimastix lanati (nom. inval.)]|nr:hypothetical protein H8356DRAFT_937586 [Neocallimastix sp. JGI-2020a]
MNNNGNSAIENKIVYSAFEKGFYPFFNALPQDVPVGWMIPFLFIIEDIQFLIYIISPFIYPKLRDYFIKVFIIFNPDIDNSLYFYIFITFLSIFILYMYFMMFSHFKSNGRKSMSKKSLWIYNSLYNIFFKYLLSYVYCFYARSIYLCNFADSIKGIPKCKTPFSYIIIGISVVELIFITAYSLIYSNFNFNTNCLSHSMYCGTMHKANCNAVLFVKLILAVLINLVTYILDDHNLNTHSILIISEIILFLSFFYLFTVQLKYQPYYSIQVNNYRFGAYFTLSIFSLYNLIIIITNINTFQIVCDISPFLIPILFIVGYNYNNYYNKKIVQRIYKKLYEKKLVSNLHKSTSINELKFNPKRLKNNNIYNSLERITKEVYIKKEIKVYNNVFECEIACRFLRKNRTIEAYLLAKELLNEGISQFNNDANVYLIAWYYLFSMKKFYKENNLLQKYDPELFNGDQILISVMEHKLDFRKKYLIHKALNHLEIEKRENSTNVTTSDIEKSIKMEELKLNAVKIHVQGLQEIKELFHKLKSSTNSKDIVLYSSNISQISKIQKLGNSHYANLLRIIPEANDVIKVYLMFLKDILNDDELVIKYTNMIQKKDENYPIKGSKSNDIDNTIQKTKSISSSNSFGSMPFSEFSTSSGLGKELKKKIHTRNSMIRNFVSPIKNLQFRIMSFVFIFILFYAIQVLCILVIFNYSQKKAENLNLNINIPGAIKESTFSVRMLSYDLMLNDYSTYWQHFFSLKGTLVYMDLVNFGLINEIMGDIKTESSLVIPVGEYAFDSYEQGTLADSYKRYISNLKYCANREMLKENETVFDILYEPHFKYFILNSKSNFDSVFDSSKEILSNSILSAFNILRIIVIIIAIILICINFFMAYITFVPLKRATNKIMHSSFRMFRHFSKSDFEQIITEYDEKIETLCETFEIDENFNNTKSKRKTKSYTKIKVIFTFIIIIIYVLFLLVPVINISNQTRDIIALIQKSIDICIILFRYLNKKI